MDDCSSLVGSHPVWPPCLETQEPAHTIPPCPLFSNWFRIVYCRWIIFADRHQTSEIRKRL